MDKHALIEAIRSALLAELETAVKAVNDAHENATHTESKAENKYDTRGLEAAYLAHGLSNRVQQLQDAIASIGQLSGNNSSPGDFVQIGSLVELEDDQGKCRHLFLSPAAGGLKLHWKGREITLVTTTAPLGRALLGRFQDDEVELSLNANKQYYSISRID